MIVSPDRKTVFVGVPKNGSQTAHQVLSGLGTALVGFRAGHPTPTRLGALLEPHGMELDPDFKLYAFWRDPVERFISGVEFYKRTLPAMLIDLLPGKLGSVTRPKQVFYEDGVGVPAAVKSAMNSVTVADVIAALPPADPMYMSGFSGVLPGNEVFQPQAYWLAYPNVVVLPFSEFEAGLKSLVTLFGGDPASVTIPTINAAPVAPPAVSQATAEAIRARYAMDYQYNPVK